MVLVAVLAENPEIAWRSKPHLYEDETAVVSGGDRLTSQQCVCPFRASPDWTGSVDPGCQRAGVGGSVEPREWTS